MRNKRTCGGVHLFRMNKAKDYGRRGVALWLGTLAWACALRYYPMLCTTLYLYKMYRSPRTTLLLVVKPSIFKFDVFFNAQYLPLRYNSLNGKCIKRCFPSFIFSIPISIINTMLKNWNWYKMAKISFSLPSKKVSTELNNFRPGNRNGHHAIISKKTN